MNDIGTMQGFSFRDTSRSAIRRLAPFAIAILLVGFVVFLRWWFADAMEGRYALLLLLSAVVVCTYLAGAWSALFATALSLIAGKLFFIAPMGDLYPIAAHDAVGLLAFTISGLLIAAVSSRMSVLQRRAARAAEQRAERIAELAEELKLADRLALIGTLATGLTHDIGNLLLPLHLRLDALETKLKAHHLSAEHVESLRTVADYLKSLSRSLGLMVTDPAHLTEQETVLHAWATDIEPLIKAAMHRRVSIHIDIPQDLPAVRIARPMLTQAVFNAVHNAAKAIGDGPGRIDITAERDAKTERVRLTIHDNGPGMSDAKVRQIMEPKPSAQTERGAAGVGLMLIKSILSAADGAVHIRSAPGEGTELSLLLAECRRLNGIEPDGEME